MFNIFIKRPVMAIVLSLLFLFMGLLAIRSLPIFQFPDIAPPAVSWFHWRFPAPAPMSWCNRP